MKIVKYFIDYREIFLFIPYDQDIFLRKNIFRFQTKKCTVVYKKDCYLENVAKSVPFVQQICTPQYARQCDDNNDSGTIRDIVCTNEYVSGEIRKTFKHQIKYPDERDSPRNTYFRRKIPSLCSPVYVES